MAGLRTTLLLLAVVPALLGALTSPAWVTVLAAPLAAAVAVAVPVLAAWGLERVRPAAPALALAGGAGALAVPLVPGAALLAPGVAVLPLAVLLLAAAVNGVSRAGAPSPRGGGAGARPRSAPGARSAPAPRR